MLTCLSLIHPFSHNLSLLVLLLALIAGPVYPAQEEVTFHQLTIGQFPTDTGQFPTNAEQRPAVDDDNQIHFLRSDKVTAIFEKTAAGYTWTGYKDLATGKQWNISGPLFSLQTGNGHRSNVGAAGFESLVEERQEGIPSVVLETYVPTPGITVRQRYTFLADGRTLRISTSLRGNIKSVTIQRVGLLEIKIEGENLRLIGPELVSSPVFGQNVFAGVEHPSAWCQVEGENLYLAQHSYTEVGPEWVSLPSAVFGTASEEDRVITGDEPVRRAFLRYLDTVRVKPADLHVHYNDWWTAPVPSSETDVLKIISELKRGLFDTTGMFFDSYAMDMGWSDPHSVWRINQARFPVGFDRIKQALGEMKAHPGLWVSPSSLYPPALDNKWLGEAGYETMPHASLGAVACLVRDGKYQQAFKAAVLDHAKAGELAHVKFDGYIPSCDVDTHGHHTGPESYQPIAEGLMEVFDALRAQNPGIALEPTCFGSFPSPWWLMHVPFVIGPFGDDSPYGRSPCPEWLESMITGREIANRTGRDAFLMPSSALQCFDIILQCPGDIQNMAAMAIGRGRWFLSCYINPKYIDTEEWRFFADLIAWARANKDFLQEPLPFGGDPAQRQAYGYRFASKERQIFCVRNPWIEETGLSLTDYCPSPIAREVRLLYPRREVLSYLNTAEALPPIHLGPYETQFIEVVPAPQGDKPPHPVQPTPPTIAWKSTGECQVVQPTATIKLEGDLNLSGIISAEVCVLCEGDQKDPTGQCSVLVDNATVSMQTSASAGAFAATVQPQKERWVWFLAPIEAGQHHVSVKMVPDPGVKKVSVFLRGFMASPETAPVFNSGPAFPLYHPESRPWSRVLLAEREVTPTGN